MFPDDAASGTPDLQGLLAQAAAMQQQLMEAQDSLAKTEVLGTAGGGLVSAKVTGTGELVGLVIDPEVIDPEEPETLADLILAAVRAASGPAGFST
jgi:DNA-binding YbaB/EbfC family protein